MVSLATDGCLQSSKLGWILKCLCGRMATPRLLLSFSVAALQSVLTEITWDGNEDNFLTRNFWKYPNKTETHVLRKWWHTYWHFKWEDISLWIQSMAAINTSLSRIFTSTTFHLLSSWCWQLLCWGTIQRNNWSYFTLILFLFITKLFHPLIVSLVYQYN